AGDVLVRQVLDFVDAVLELGRVADLFERFRRPRFSRFRRLAFSAGQLVLRRGIGEQAVEDFAKLGGDHGVIVRKRQALFVEQVAPRRLDRGDQLEDRQPLRVLDFAAEDLADPALADLRGPRKTGFRLPSALRGARQKRPDDHRPKLLWLARLRTASNWAYGSS